MASHAGADLTLGTAIAAPRLAKIVDIVPGDPDPDRLVAFLIEVEETPLTLTHSILALTLADARSAHERLGRVLASMGPGRRGYW